MKNPQKKETLSLCMIVKNEQEFLEDCLESVKGVVDQIVIVDTGSTDNTVDIAKRYGAEVHQFKWCDDFSAARNESIRYAKGDWILWMDADERLLPESKPALIRILKPERKPVAYRVHIKNLKKDGINYFLSDAHRIFNNNRGVYFEGIIHEQIAYSVTRLKGEERDSDIFLYHLGYSFKGDKADIKSQRNYKLLTELTKKNPENAYAHYTLAQYYGMHNEYELALKHCKLAYRLNQFDKRMTVSLINVMSEALLKLGNYSEARKFSLKSAELEPSQCASYYLLYKIAYEQERYDESVKWLCKLLEQTRKLRNHKKAISTDLLIDENKILYTLGNTYLKMGEVNAIKCFEEFLLKEQDNVAVLKKLVDLYSSTNNLEKAREKLESLYNITGDVKYLSLLGDIFIKQSKFEDAIENYEVILSKYPDNKVAVKRLIGLYGKVGDIEKANFLLKNL